jgi:uncharacterized Zn finger protein
VLVDMLLESGDTEAALDVRRAEFERHPTAAAYRSLTDTAATVDAQDPAPWALAMLRDRVVEQPAYASELIDVLLAADRDDEAWQAGPSHQQWLGECQWLALLDRRGAAYPADVIEPYQDLVERHILDSADKRRYRRAVALLPALHAAYRAAGQPEAFPQYLADLRVRHKRRPTFLKTLAATGL